MPYKSLCIQIRSRAWLGRRPWRQRVGLAFLMLHTRLSSTSLPGIGASTDSHCQHPAPVPTIYSKQIPEEQAGHNPLGPTNPWLCRAKTQVGMLTLQGLQDLVACIARGGGVTISPPKCWRILLSLRCGQQTLGSGGELHSELVTPLLGHI